MDYSQMLNIKILPVEVSKSLMNEQGCHLSYHIENRIYECVKQGDLQRLFKEITKLKGISVGQMSANNVNQYKYMAVACITLATRSAIEGGLDEEEAYTFSDLFIQQIDTAKTQAKIIKLIAEGVIKLTNSVNAERKKTQHSYHIRKCITYIDKNLGKRITLRDLATECGLSEDYLSRLFKREMGVNISEYILNAKLEASKTLLLDNIDNSTICYSLAFSSQSHFITSFKKKYNMTPREFATLYKG